MKNHVSIDGKLLQTNKTWGHLKREQQEWICRTARERYLAFIERRGKLPVEGSKKQLIEEIYIAIQEREIWIPNGEVNRVLSRRIAHWNRQREAGTEEAGAHNDQQKEPDDHNDQIKP